MGKFTKPLVLILVFTILSTNAYATTMYAPDGRTINVDSCDVHTWENAGWYSYPVVAMYATDGRAITVSASSVSSWEAVGWIDGRKTAIVYASDGRTATIPLWQVGAYKAVGWYDYPITNNYNSFLFYPDSTLPTYESVTGTPCMDSLHAGTSHAYSYNSNNKDLISYLSAIAQNGWIYTGMDDDYESQSVTAYYTKDIYNAYIRYKKQSGIVLVVYGIS